MIIFLTGFMGCGKSTLGRLAAAKGGLVFIDTDRKAEEATGKTVAEIFARDGEETFRELESRILRNICIDQEGSQTDIIVATGGGTPCHGENLRLMKRHGIVVYLETSTENLFRRLSSGRRKRPKIANMDDSDLRQFIEKTLAQREPYYSQASVKIDCNGVSDESIADLILSLPVFGIESLHDRML